MTGSKIEAHLKNDTHLRWRLHQLAADNEPITTRRLFYMAVEAGLVEQTPDGYERVREELDLQ